jgi:hypothetical protein
MSLEKNIKAVLFELGKEIKFHQLDQENMIIEIDYDKYTAELMDVFKDYLENKITNGLEKTN